jgi:deferrochelatase/peroxidase EfeB
MPPLPSNSLSSWLETKALETPITANHPKPAEKLAALLMGRWRNGTPVHENPDHDDNTELHKSNNFDYEPREAHDKCPFAAHTRKMRPRADLANDHAVIIRRGIPYGPEVSAKEKTLKTSVSDRGLLFACYQSDLRNGFNFLTTRKIYFSSHIRYAQPLTSLNRLGQQPPLPEPQAQVRR